MLKLLAMRLLQVSGVNALARSLTASAARIVTYHGVERCEDPVINLDRLQVDPDLFARQLDEMGRHFQWVTLGDLAAGIRGERPMPSRALAVTFDDGYRNNLDEAAPILRAKGIPATFFITSRYVEQRSRPWWYALRAALSRARVPSVLLPDGRRASLAGAEGRRDAAMVWESRLRHEPAVRQESLLRELMHSCGEPDTTVPFAFMSADEVAQLARQGFDVQSHGAAHWSAATEPADAFVSDAAESIERCRAWSGRSPTAFAFPYGDLPPAGSRVDDGLRAMGLSVAVTTRTGLNRHGARADRLRRFDVNAGRSPLNLTCILSGMPPGARGA